MAIVYLYTLHLYLLAGVAQSKVCLLMQLQVVEVETQEAVDVACHGWDHLTTSSPGRAIRGVLQKLSGLLGSKARTAAASSRL